MRRAVDNPLFEYLLQQGDTVLVLGHRLSEWCGHGPFLEEDIAMTNIALDLVGQSRAFLSYAGEVEGRGRDEDALAFLRDATDYRNVLLAEQPNGDFAVTMMRQFLFDAFQVPLYEKLSSSTDSHLGAIAARGLKEARYHLRHSRDWVVRLGDGTDESHDRLQAGLDRLWRFTGELFVADAALGELYTSGVAIEPSTLEPAWKQTVEQTFEAAHLTPPADTWMQDGGREGKHTEHLGFILAEMQSLQRTHPGATW